MRNLTTFCNITSNQFENVAQACEKICGVYGQDAVSKSAVRKWLTCFFSGNFDFKDAPCSGQPITEKVDEIMQKIEADRYMSNTAIARELNIEQKTILNRLKKTGYKKKLDVWVPHELINFIM